MINVIIINKIMDIANELIHLILTYLDEFTKFRLYQSSKIPYLSSIKIHPNGTMVLKKRFTNELLQNFHIRYLILTSDKIKHYQYGMKTLVLSKFNAPHNLLIPSTLIKVRKDEVNKFISKLH